ncbi:MAG: PIN domain-containing protein [Actinobacteria bacterium]|nr:PIN domain-containing protein [Actinomycetota bacterium]
MRMVFLDSCVVIEASEQSRKGARLRARFAELASVELAISPLVRLESLVRPIRDRDTERLAVRQSLLDRCVQLPIDDAMYALATHIRARHGLSTADSVHVATASRHGCDEFWTDDRQLLRAAPGFVIDVFGEA